MGDNTVVDCKSGFLLPFFFFFLLVPLVSGQTVWRVASFGVHTIDMGIVLFCANVRQKEKSFYGKALNVAISFPFPLFPFGIWRVASFLFYPPVHLHGLL